MDIIEQKSVNFDPLDFFQKIADNRVSFFRSQDWIIIAWRPYKTKKYINSVPFEDLKNISRAGSKNPFNLPFIGGAIGAFSYDLGYNIFTIGQTAKSSPRLPKAVIYHYDNFLCHNIKTHRTFLPKKLRAEFQEIDSRPLTRGKVPTFNLQPEITRGAYNKAYQKIKNYILNGDIYEVNLTHRLTASFRGDPKALFAKAYHHNPAVFSAFFETDDFHILSLSPERFIQLKNGILTTTPIKGTVPITSDPNELLDSSKDAAELNMITDLLRNDLGRVSKIGTVKVTKNRALMKAGSVWHTYSQIQSRLDKGKTAADVMAACFPGGSITGCPKKRSIEIIDELEPVTRGYYTGTIGCFSRNGDMDTNILIRTLVHHKNKLYLGVGGAIVVDSNPKSEYEETLHKAKTFLELNRPPHSGD